MLLINMNKTMKEKLLLLRRMKNGLDYSGQKQEGQAWPRDSRGHPVLVRPVTVALC